MKVLHFPNRRRAEASVPTRLAALEAMLVDCRHRQRSLREDGVRLAVSSRRLRTLAARMSRSGQVLRKALRRMRELHRAILPRTQDH